MFMFDDYELTLVSEFEDGDNGIYCEPYTKGDEDEINFKQKIWSIYGHYPNDGSYKDPKTGESMQGVDCLCDFNFESEKYAQDVYDHFMNTLKISKENSK